MKIVKNLVPALICVAATSVIATGTAGAAPSMPTALQIAGTDAEVAYQVALSPDHRSVVTDLESGRFDLNTDAGTVSVVRDDGSVVAEVPLTLEIDGKTAQFTAAVDDGDRRLTLRPVAESATPVRDIDLQQQFFDTVQANLPGVLAGAAIGAAIGFVAGFPLGLFVVDFITAPLLGIAGGLAGAFVGLQQSGGQPAVDTALAYADSLIPGASQAIRPLTGLGGSPQTVR